MYLQKILKITLYSIQKHKKLYIEAQTSHRKISFINISNQFCFLFRISFMFSSWYFAYLSSWATAHRKFRKAWTITANIYVILFLDILVVTKCVLLDGVGGSMLLAWIKSEICIRYFNFLTEFSFWRIFHIFFIWSNIFLLTFFIFLLILNLTLFILTVLLIFLKLISTIFILLKTFFKVVLWNFLLVSKSISLNKFFNFTFNFLLV